ncbi:MAG: hypothetical protein RBG13Loki_3192 [Promethearchaeota archaeon CR_4]|nr:MAG: hypothetical protein RBG13Loki_3192 [Candidatus Lokiarchaeota archaeon CR_4]
MKEIYIIDQRAGTAIFHRSFGALKVDPDLISGLLAAMNQLTEVELAGRGIEAIVMGGLQWIYTKHNPLNLLIIAADSRDRNPELTRSRLDYIIKSFLEFFQITPENWEKIWYGEYSKFNAFNPLIDQCVQQWSQAEGVLGAAELFDILGLYQQIFNMMTNIIRRNFFKEKLARIKIQMKEYHAELTKECESDPEMPKLAYDGNIDWDFMAIDPLSVNANKLKSVLMQSTQKVKGFVTQGLGKMILLNEFSKEILPFLITNWDQLNKLEMLKPLVELFLC